MSRSKFFDKMQVATFSTMNTSDREKIVESVYNEGIAFYFKSDITHPYKTDAYIESTTPNNKIVRLLAEYKFDKDMEKSIARAKVLVQVLYYLKKFESNGCILPNVILVGDVNECFVIHTNLLIQYLDENVDWSISPSNAADANMDLCIKISENKEINPFIFSIDENFSFKTVADKICDLADNVKRYVHVTEHNVSIIFNYFCDKVIADKSKISANDIVSIFLGIIRNSDEYYMHPKKKNVLVTPRMEVKVKDDSFERFVSYFKRNYTPQEHMLFDSISDRLIEDTNRRAKGEFYTPTLFVDYAHKMISEQFGENWRDEYVVWDNCCGTKNLTRDYRFKELYCSTLEEAELEISERYNKEAVSFKFDFLNDSLDKLPEGLLNTFRQNKPIIFFLNPPYATAANNMGADGTHKGGCAVSMMNQLMKTDKIGACSQNLYAQFLYRIELIKKQYNLTKCSIALFSPTLFLSGPAWKGFRKSFLNDFAFNSGIQFKASHFANVADNWGIAFTLWTSGETIDKENFTLNSVDNVDGEIKTVSSKIVYNIDKAKTASDWAKEDVKNLPTFDKVQLQNAIAVKTKNQRGSIFEGSLGYFFNNSNNVDMNAQKVGLFSATYGNGHGHGISKDNFNKCVSLFSARKLIEKDWINSKDEYLAPNESHPKYNEFVNDSIVYSLFHSSSNQSSLRQIDYKGKKWDIKNEFFFMSREEMLGLANEHNNEDVYQDAYTDKDRYVYTLLNDGNIQLSEEAQKVLNKAKELVRKSFKYRKIFNEENENYFINTWDAGWYQIKAMLKSYMKNDFEEFNGLYKALADKMRPMVYELGFLK